MSYDSPAPGARASSARANHLSALATALAAIAVYANSLANGFAYDDEWIILNRRLVSDPEGLWQILTANFWPEIFVSAIYRPATLLSFVIDWQIWNGAPFGFHLTNVLLHAGVSALVVYFLARFFPWWAALAGGLVFAVHSVHTEVVANVVGRAELLTSIAILAATLVYIRAVGAERISIAAIGIICALYAAAGFSKEVGVVMPGLLLAADLPMVARLSREDWRGFVRKRVPLFASLTAVLVLVLAARVAVLGTAVGSVPARAFAMDDSFPTRIFTMARVWPRMLELLFFPMDLSADYSPAVILPVTELTVGGVGGVLLLLALVVVAAVTFRRRPEIAMACAWAGLALLPASNILFTAETILGERRLYLPSIAVSIVVATLLVASAGRRRQLVAALMAIWVIGFSIVTVKRNPVWRSTDSVFVDLLKNHPESSRLLFRLGLRHHELGNFQESRAWIDRSLEVWPWYAPYHARYTTILLDQGMPGAAVESARRATELDPAFRGNHKLLVLALLIDGRYAEAAEAVERALELVEADHSLYTQLADARAAMGDFEAAARAQSQAIAAGRFDWAARARLAGFQAQAGDTAAALETLAEARGAPGANAAEADSLVQLWSRSGADR